MPRTPCSIIVNPQVPVTVTITTAGGVTVTAYTTKDGASTHSLPLAITTSTQFFLTDRGVYTISALYNGHEIAGPAGATQSVEVLAGAVNVAVGIDQPGEASVVQATLAHGTAFTQTYSTTTRTVPNATYAAPTVTQTSVATTSATNVSPYGYAQAQADAIVAQVNAGIVDGAATNAKLAALAVDVLELKKLIGAIIDDGQAGVLPG